MLTKPALKKILFAKPLFVVVLGFLCWFGLNAIIDFSDMPAMINRNLHHYYIYRHTVALFIGVIVFLFAIRYGVYFNKYYLYFIGFAALLVVLPFVHGSNKVENCRRWFEYGNLLLRVCPAILLFLLPAFCIFCDRIENNIHSRKNIIYLASLVILSNISFLLLHDCPLLLLSDIIFFLIILSCKIKNSIKFSFLAYFTLTCFILVHSEITPMLHYFAFTIDSIDQLLKTGSLDMFKYYAGYQPFLAYKDIASGGLFGIGFGGYSEVTKWTYPLPTISSFIFQIIGKEYGIFGLCFCILLFSYLFIFLTFHRKKMEKNVNEKIVYAMTLFVIVPALLGIIRTFSFLPYFPSYQIPFLGYGSDWLVLYFLAAGTALSHFGGPVPQRAESPARLHQ